MRRIGSSVAGQALIEDAWALLHLNLDLVEWAVCVGYCGAMNVGDVPRHEVRWRCLQDQLYGVGTQLSIQVDCGDEYPLGEPVAWVYSLDAGHSLRGYPDYTYIHDSIHFYAPQEGSHFEDVVENYCTGSYETKVCLAVYIASVLLHEMAHTCGASYFDGGGAPCRASYLIDQTFLWAMLNRYPAGLLSGCCDQWRANNLVNPYTGRMGPVDELFMSDGNNIQQKVDC